MDYKYYKHYCDDIENVENFDKALADDFKNWDIHHRLETHTSDGERRLIDISKAELKALDMYYNRPANELLFITRKEHCILHNPNKGRQFSEEHKNRLSESHKGHSPGNKGKKMSDNQKKRLSEAIKKAFSLGEASKKISESKKGRHWYNNGEISVMRFECPEGFIPGRLK